MSFTFISVTKVGCFRVIIEFDLSSSNYTNSASFHVLESVIYCARRPKAKFISISETEDGKREPPIRFIDRTNPGKKA